MTNTFCVGKDGPEEAAKRTFSNFHAESCNIPVFRFIPKLHKPVGPDGLPKTRPIIEATTSMATRPSEVISAVLDCFIEGTECIECISTDEMVSKINIAKK